MDLVGDRTQEDAARSPGEVPATEMAGVDAISRLIDQAQDDQGATRPLMEPKAAGAAGKRRPGRPRKNPEDPKWGEREAQAAAEAVPPGPPPFDATSAFRDFFKVSSRILVAKTQVEECALQDAEVEGLATSWGAVANQYMPAFLAKHGPLLAATMVTTSVAMRLNATLQAEIERRKAERATHVENEEQAAA